MREYLDHVSALNQLLCIAKQLRSDVEAKKHKYTAHKIALLYHAINSSKLARDVLRKRIEEHFEDVKDATETQEVPILPDHLSHWILVSACLLHASAVGQRDVGRWGGDGGGGRGVGTMGADDCMHAR